MSFDKLTNDSGYLFGPSLSSERDYQNDFQSIENEAKLCRFQLDGKVVFSLLVNSSKINAQN